MSRVRAWIREHRLALAFALAAVLVRIAFWAYTGRTWEDALITVTHARNAAAGLGLVHHPGEGRVHGFTSALSVLVPLAGELLHAGWGLAAIRLASLAAAAFAILAAEQIARRLALGTGATIFLFAYLAFDRNQIFYGMAGMETQLAVALVLSALAAERPATRGAAAGLCLLCRPDLVLLVLPLLVAWRSRRAAAIALAVVAPWIVFTTLYYGSPIPNTILAKAAAGDPIPRNPIDLALWVGGRVSYHRHDWCYLAPFVCDGFADGPLRSSLMPLIAHPTYVLPLPLPLLFVISLATIALAVAGARRLPVAALFAAVFEAYRILLLPQSYFEWYLPPFLAVVALLAACGIARLERRAGLALAIALALAALVHLPWTFVLEERIQHRIEEPVRGAMGRFLAKEVKPGEGVVSESAGYVGWESNVLLWDFPGLTSPTVRRALAPVPRGTRERTLERTIALLAPPWCVLRPFELAQLLHDFPRAAVHYRVVKTFEARDPDLEWGGYLKVSVDTQFFVLHRL